jgi:hypothetical protein
MTKRGAGWPGPIRAAIEGGGLSPIVVRLGDRLLQSFQVQPGRSAKKAGPLMLPELKDGDCRTPLFRRHRHGLRERRGLRGRMRVPTLHRELLRKLLSGASAADSIACWQTKAGVRKSWQREGVEPGYDRLEEVASELAAYPGIDLIREAVRSKEDEW